MAKIIGLPKLSPTMDEGTLAKWHKKEGDAINVDDLLAEVETDKATMEFRSFDKGVLLKIFAPEGTTLAPDAPVMIVGNAGEDISALIASVKGGAAPAAAATPATPPTAAPTVAPVKTAAPAAAPAAATSAAPIRAENERIYASPLVRRIAREQDIDLAAVSGTGPRGRIIKRDLDSLSSAGSVAAPTAAAPAFVPVAAGETRVEKLSQMRKTIARRLTESKQTVPHFYLTINVDAEPLVAGRAAINASLEKSGEKISLNDLIIKACAVGLRRVPEVNASFMGDSIHYHGNVDISVAVAIPDGLITPVVRFADQKGLLAISHEVRELAGRAKAKKLRPEEITGGTFSISNLGMFDIDNFAAVINPPEGAILAVGSVREEPVVKNGALAVGKRMSMTLSCDHRVVDGAIGARFLQVLRELLEKPLTMLI